MKYKLLLALLVVLVIPNIALASQKTYSVKFEGKPANKDLVAVVNDIASDIIFSHQITVQFKPTVFKCHGVWAVSCRDGDTIEIVGSARNLDAFRWTFLNELSKN